MPNAEQLTAMLNDSTVWFHRTVDGCVVRGTANPRLVFPGSFNPRHHGHQTLARLAEQHLGGSIAYEISVANVDKPPLSVGELQRRLAQFHDAAVCITSAPLFATKAQLFPHATFVIGADTAIRIVDAKYYAQGERGMLEALQQIREQGCRFFVGGRMDKHGHFHDVERLTFPDDVRDLFMGVREEQFRVDISSTELRRSC